MHALVYLLNFCGTLRKLICGICSVIEKCFSDETVERLTRCLIHNYEYILRCPKARLVCSFDLTQLCQ